MREYAASETIDYTRVPLTHAVSQAYPAGVDVLIDLASGRDGFAALAVLVRSGGTALTTRHVAGRSYITSKRGRRDQLRRHNVG